MTRGRFSLGVSDLADTWISCACCDWEIVEVDRRPFDEAVEDVLAHELWHSQRVCAKTHHKQGHCRRCKTVIVKKRPMPCCLEQR